MPPFHEFQLHFGHRTLDTDALRRVAPTSACGGLPALPLSMSHKLCVVRFLRALFASSYAVF